jgi:hypothetical protein
MLPFLSPRSPISMLSLCHGILPKVVSALFTILGSFRFDYEYDYEYEIRQAKRMLYAYAILY